MDEQFISLKELTNHLRKVISYNMRDLIWVRCEVSSVSSNRGHYYLHLVEQEGQVQVAKINAVIWAKDAQFLEEKVW